MKKNRYWNFQDIYLGIYTVYTIYKSSDIK